MSSTIRVTIPLQPVPERPPRPLIVPVSIVAGITLVVGSIAGVIIERTTRPQLEITGPQAARTVEEVLQRDYGLEDATDTSCDQPERTPLTTFTCTSATSAVESGQVTVTVTVLNRGGQLSVGSPMGEEE